jgi:uncharacterized membrane protein
MVAGPVPRKSRAPSSASDTLRGMRDVLLWIENSAAGVFVREWPSILGFPTILFLHTLGLAMVAGAAIAIDLWILQRPQRLTPVQLAGLNKMMWLGFLINLLSGLALLLAYPAKALTNGVFYLKMALVLGAVYLSARIHREFVPIDAAGVGAGLPPAARRWAAASLVCWLAAIVTGRLLAYTYNVLFASQLP